MFDGAMCSRRRSAMRFRAMVVGVVAVLATGLAFVPTCSLGAEPTGRLTLGTGDPPETLDPHISITLPSWTVVRNVFDSLLVRDLKTYGYKPGLAESHQIVNDTTWQFKLRKGVKFHNGEELNAEAVRFSVERVINPEQKSPSRGQNVLIERVEVVDPYTVNIITRKPMPMLRERFVSPGYTGTISIVPPKYIREKGDQYFNTNPVGTGPFRVVKWVKGDYVELEANKEYRGGPPKIKTVIIKAIPEPTTRVSALLTGDADIIESIPPDLVESVKKAPSAHVAETDVDGVPTDVEFNATKGGPLADPGVRCALSSAVDMDLVVKKIVRGYGARRPVPLDPRAFGYNPNLPLQKHDLDKAKKLLAEAGHPNGQGIPELEFLYMRGGGGILLVADPIAEYVAQQFSKLGVRVQLIPLDSGAFSARSRDKKAWDMRMTGWGGGGRFEVGDTLFFEYHSSAPSSGLNDKEFDLILDRARETMEPEARKQLYWKAQELVYNRCGSLPTFQNKVIFGVRNDIDWSPSVGQFVILHQAGRKK
jgi:peptide/nickel transport system substrate-binding protein